VLEVTRGARLLALATDELTHEQEHVEDVQEAACDRHRALYETTERFPGRV
jgi:hypothetical protein